MPLSATAIRHVAFEGLGIIDPALRAAGYEPHTVEASIDDLRAVDPLGVDLLVVLGGPIGAYEDDRYPFLADELRLIEQRLAAGRPTLGICLGAQLMARALGARVTPGPAKEIGWAPVTLTTEGRGTSLAHLEGTPVLHWHGDTFDLPTGAALLASTDLCTQQAFAIDHNALGLQFHGEVDAADIERWLVGHACEIAATGLDPRTLRADSARHGAALRDAGTRMFTDWLARLDGRRSEASA